MTSYLGRREAYLHQLIKEVAHACRGVDLETRVAAIEAVLGTRPPHSYRTPKEGPKAIPQPPPKIIDWSQVAPHVPVRVWTFRKVDRIRFNCIHHPHNEDGHIFSAQGDYHQHASLETGHWVFNHDSKNPWPAGIMVERWLHGSKIPQVCTWNADELNWVDGSIAATRAVGLVDGYVYG